MTLFDKLWLLASQALNTLAYDGDPDESLSARAWRERFTAEWTARRAKIDGKLGLGHCETVWKLQQAREDARRSIPHAGK